ncbi:ArpU family phage packaging/lysis transcriptional regulator [Bacillus sp. 3255]|uniref:ArpU family phage packaging/lysis transcriptional regulator n=1 Tax=Bacillus sp. 3255 TaxID=2817904 RepID=UPI00285A3B15|nr:ArpU family phage packaging/lysis transcriptional regulator [Bacillus sp. 3255]MDR6883045.1 ArpU family phage transcriptional regulator [Bacillus sp. 3255]
MAQLSLGDDFLKEIDRDLTKEAVERYLAEYRMFKHMDFESREATITAAYSDMPRSSPTNVTSDQTANIAIFNVDEPARRKKHCERLEAAVKRLPRMERLLMESRYLSDDAEYITDYNVYNHVFNPPIGATFYRKIRNKAFYKIALALDIEVYKESEPDKKQREKKESEKDVQP